MEHHPVDIWRTPVFQKWVQKVWTEEEYSEFRTFLAHYPEAGQIEPGTSGVRKSDGDAAGSARAKEHGSSIIL